MSKDVNPFKYNTFNGNFTDIIRGQVFCLSVGDSIQADLNGRKVSEYRTTLIKVAEGRKFKTKTAKDGSLWIMRIA